MKIKSLDYDFSKREVAFVAVIAILALSCAILAWQISQRERVSSIDSFDKCVAAGNETMDSYPAKCEADGQTFTDETANYTDSLGIMSIVFPTTMEIEVDEGQPESTNEKPIFQSFTVTPVVDETGDSSLHVFGDTNGMLKESMTKIAKEKSYPTEQKFINGNQADYIKIDFKSDVEQYLDHVYLVYNGEETVMLTYRERHSIPATNLNIDNSKYLSDYESIVNSVMFL